RRLIAPAQSPHRLTWRNRAVPENRVDWRPMATIDRSLVEKLPLFAGLDSDALDEILSAARSARYPKNTAVFRQGQPADSFLLLLHGHIRATKATPAGDQIVVRYVTPGEIFGVAPAIGLTTYPATATAADDSVALSWPSAAWPQLVARHPSLATNTLQTVGARLQESHTRVMEMSTEQVERRIAHALLRLATRTGPQGGHGVRDGFPRP